MKEIIRITLGLTVSCLLAAFFMGGVFAVTDKAKKYNERTNIQETMLGLLGYSQSNPPPNDLKLYSIYRYILEEAGRKDLGYMTPVRRDGKETYELVIMDPAGHFIQQVPLKIDTQEAAEPVARQKAVSAAIPSGTNAAYADSAVIATRGSKRIAYLLPGEFPGFKTFVKVMLALDPAFDILGLEITEQEEDPGLGAEITKPYFKGQFVGKSFDTLKKLEVVKEPIPEDYLRYLEGEDERLMSEKDLDAIRSKYADHDIYALTGATISSRAVTSGVKNVVRKFAYRLSTLDRVITSQGIPVAF